MSIQAGWMDQSQNAVPRIRLSTERNKFPLQALKQKEEKTILCCPFFLNYLDI